MHRPLRADPARRSRLTFRTTSLRSTTRYAVHRAITLNENPRALSSRPPVAPSRRSPRIECNLPRRRDEPSRRVGLRSRVRTLARSHLTHARPARDGLDRQLRFRARGAMRAAVEARDDDDARRRRATARPARRVGRRRRRRDERASRVRERGGRHRVRRGRADDRLTSHAAARVAEVARSPTADAVVGGVETPRARPSLAQPPPRRRRRRRPRTPRVWSPREHRASARCRRPPSRPRRRRRGDPSSAPRARSQGGEKTALLGDDRDRRARRRRRRPSRTRTGKRPPRSRSTPRSTTRSRATRWSSSARARR